MRWHRSPVIDLLDDDGRDQIAARTRAAWWDFEHPLPLVVAALCRQDRAAACYDVGANTGYYSVLAGQVLRRDRVRAFEPVPQIADRLRANLDRHGVEARVLEVALSEEVGSAPLFLPPAGHGLVETSGSLDAGFKPAIAGSIRVATTTLDEVNTGFGGERVGLIKIDVEGCEARVLAGADGVVARDRPVVALEILHIADYARIDGFAQRHGLEFLSLPAQGPPQRQPAARFLPDSWNQLLVPRERLEEVGELVAAELRRHRAAMRRPRAALHRRRFLSLRRDS